MPETTPVVADVNVDTIDFNAFDTEGGASVQSATSAAPAPVTPATPTAPTAATTTPATQEEVFDENDYIKKTFGWENAETAKRELEELRALKNNPQVVEKEFKFANEDSKKLFDYIKENKRAELREILNREHELSAADSLNAENAIKLQLKLENGHFKQADIEDIWEERYSKPPKPVKDEDEDEVFYSQRLNKWQSDVEKIDRRIERDGFSAKQSLGKIKSELVLPDIAAQAGQPTPEQIQKDMDDAKKAHDAYVAALEADSKKFNGVAQKYEDKDASYDVSFAATPEQVSDLTQRLRDFNVTEYFGNRWFDENGVANVNRIMSDLFMLENQEKVFQKFLADAGAQRLEQHIKGRKQIQIETTPQQAAPPQQSYEAALSQLGEVAFSV